MIHISRPHRGATSGNTLWIRATPPAGPDAKLPSDQTVPEHNAGWKSAEFVGWAARHHYVAIERS